MGLLNAFYVKFRTFIRFIERTDKEFLEGEEDSLLTKSSYVERETRPTLTPSQPASHQWR
jgi:hypothetical protein